MIFNNWSKFISNEFPFAGKMTMKFDVISFGVFFTVKQLEWFFLTQHIHP